MGYYINLEAISIDQYKHKLKTGYLPPSRMILKDNLDNRLDYFDTIGIKNVKELLQLLKKKDKFYILHFKDIAISEMRTSKIPASITLAQGLLESGSGKGRLALKANNHFGIKCHGWTGGKIYHDDDEKQECFRKYNHASQSFKDHSDFLANRKRYAKLFQLDITDYKSWAKELRKAGYATDRKYPEKLISLIERYELYKYDEVVAGKSKRRKNNTTITEHVVVKGDTLYSISRKYNISVEDLKRINNLDTTTISIGQRIVIK